MGFMVDNLISCCYCDGWLILIGGGVDEVMLGIIVKFEGIMLEGRG